MQAQGPRLLPCVMLSCQTRMRHVLCVRHSDGPQVLSLVLSQEPSRPEGSQSRSQEEKARAPRWSRRGESLTLWEEAGKEGHAGDMASEQRLIERFK